MWKPSSYWSDDIKNNEGRNIYWDVLCSKPAAIDITIETTILEILSGNQAIFTIDIARYRDRINDMIATL